MDSRNVYQSDSNRQQQLNVGQLANRLSGTASSTAQFLYTIAHTEPSMVESKIDLDRLAQKGYTLAAALTSLRETLTLCGRTAIWNNEHGENLLRCMKDCEGVLCKVNNAVRTADKVFSRPKAEDTGKACAEAFVLDSEHEAWDILEKCFQFVLKTTIVARYAALTQLEYLHDDDLSETLRLASALKHSEIKDIRVSTYASPLFENLQQHLPLSSQTPLQSSTDQKELEPGYVSPIVPSTQAKDPVPKKQTPIWAYNQWPPFGNPRHPAYLAAMDKRLKTDSDTAIVDSSTSPTSTPEGFAETNQTSERPCLPNFTPQPVSRTILFGQPSVLKLPSKDDSSFTTNPFAAFPTLNRPNVNVFPPAPHLEAYVLRPVVQTTDTSSIWSYETESLRLDEEAMMTHVHKLEADHSIIDSLIGLHPQQLCLVQLRAKQRHGNIVSVQHGRSVDTVTQMGTFQVKHVIFIIRTSTILGQDDHEPPKSVPISPGPNPMAGKDLFAGTTPTVGFGSNTHLTSSPETYSEYLHRQDEPCTYVERSECQSGVLQHYQTITANKIWHNQDRSLEEIRLADYVDGRKGPRKTNGAFYPWGQTLSVKNKGPHGGSRGLGQFESASATHIEDLRKVCFPTTFLPSSSSSGFGNPSPRVGLFGQPVSEAKTLEPSFEQSMKSGALHVVQPSHGLFSQVQPNLPPFVPPTGTQQSIFSTTPAPLCNGNLWDPLRASVSTSSVELPTLSAGSSNSPLRMGLFGAPIPDNTTSTPSFGTSTEPGALCMLQPRRGLFGQALSSSPPGKGLFSGSRAPVTSNATSTTTGPFGMTTNSSPRDDYTRTAVEIKKPSLFGITPAAPPSTSSHAPTTSNGTPASWISTAWSPFGSTTITRALGGDPFGATQSSSPFQKTHDATTPSQGQSGYISQVAVSSKVFDSAAARQAEDLELHIPLLPTAPPISSADTNGETTRIPGGEGTQFTEAISTTSPHNETGETASVSQAHVTGRPFGHKPEDLNTEKDRAAKIFVSPDC